MIAWSKFCGTAGTHSQNALVNAPGISTIVANPPFSLPWEPNDILAEDFRFKNYGLVPKSAADFAFLIHGFHYLSNEGTMAIILPHGVLFRGGAREGHFTHRFVEDLRVLGSLFNEQVSY